MHPALGVDAVSLDERDGDVCEIRHLRDERVTISRKLSRLRSGPASPEDGPARRVLTLAPVDTPPPSPTLLPAPRIAWLPRDHALPAQAQAAAWLAESLAIAPTQVTFARDTFGRPQLQAPLQAHDCNWSHSGEGLLVAVGAGIDLGVDLEWRRPRPRC